MISFLLLIVLLAGCAPPPKPVEAPSYFRVDASTAGTIRGTVKFSGKKPAARVIPLDADAQCMKLHKGGTITEEGVILGSEGGVGNVFVYLKTGLEGKAFAPVKEAVVIDQKGCWFTPRVIGMQTGQPLRVTNSDPVTHNIHPQPRRNRDWNQSQAPEDPPLVRRFAVPEVMIPVKCNVHNWMRAWIGVLDHPYFAVTGADGSFEIRNVPPGSYTVAAWQEKLGTEEQAVTLAASAKRELTFRLKGN
ncbi:MAG: carboxypeptidase regulatory-like domain-containing protein [Acidobacteria bacterium]|nr:carboxypeptidase regulatory-like domain-containing protein [Acidobacteriota bacterium]